MRQSWNTNFPFRSVSGQTTRRQVSNERLESESDAIQEIDLIFAASKRNICAIAFQIWGFPGRGVNRSIGTKRVHEATGYF